MQHHIIVVHILHDMVLSSLKRHTSHITVPRKSASPKQTLSWAAGRARDGYAKLRWKRCQSNAWFTSVHVEGNTHAAMSNGEMEAQRWQSQGRKRRRRPGNPFGNFQNVPEVVEMPGHSRKAVKSKERFRRPQLGSLRKASRSSCKRPRNHRTL